MADLSKFEQMLERLINEDRDGAQDLFHEIVVEKSRSIYESLLESDDEDEEMEEASEEDEDEDDVKEEKDEDDDEEGYNEDFNLDEFEVEADDDMMGGDATDDMIGDLGAEDGEDDEVDFDMGGEGEEGDVEDRVVDLEDALDELKAEFDKMMGGEDDMGFMPGDDDGQQDMGDDEEGDFGDDEEGDEEEEDESFQFEAKKDDKKDDKKDSKKDAKKKTSGEEMREYVEKVQGGDLGSKIGGDNGTNTKSTVASPNKMGDGTTDNIARSDEYSNGDHAGLGDLNAKDQDAGNVNKPGGKASKSMKAQPKGHGTEKKGSGESGAYTKPVVGGSKKK